MYRKYFVDVWLYSTTQVFRRFKLSQSLCFFTCERIFRAGPSLSPSVSSRCSSERSGSVSPSIMWSLKVCRVEAPHISTTPTDRVQYRWVIKRVTGTNLSVFWTCGYTVDKVVNVIHCPLSYVFGHLITIKKEIRWTWQIQNKLNHRQRSHFTILDFIINFPNSPGGRKPFPDTGNM